MKGEIVEALAHLAAEFWLKPTGVLQIGAHEGQERAAYVAESIPAAVFVEPNVEVYLRLVNNLAGIPNFSALNAVCSAINGTEVLFNIASNEESSSILPLGEHGKMFPDIVYSGNVKMISRSIDSISDEVGGQRLNFLVMDAQGSELDILRGAPRYLETCRAIFVEVSEMPLYDGGCTLNDLIAYLNPRGFSLKWAKVGRWRIGDALFVKA